MYVFFTYKIGDIALLPFSTNKAVANEKRRY